MTGKTIEMRATQTLGIRVVMTQSCSCRMTDKQSFVGRMRRPTGESSTADDRCPVTRNVQLPNMIYMGETNLLIGISRHCDTHMRSVGNGECSTMNRHTRQKQKTSRKTASNGGSVSYARAMNHTGTQRRNLAAMSSVAGSVRTYIDGM